jgi:hypothetical protein
MSSNTLIFYLTIENGLQHDADNATTFERGHHKREREGERVWTRVEMKSYATYHLPLNVIKLSDKIIPCHVGVCPGAVI